MQYTHLKLQRSVIDTRSVSSGRFSRSRRGSTVEGYRESSGLLGPALRELHDRCRGEAHVLDADPLALAVGVVAAREDVRGRQAHLRERRAVGAAANRGHPRLEPDTADGLLQVRDDLGMPLKRVAHVAVLDEGLDLDRATLVGRSDLGGDLPQEVDVLVEEIVLEV